MLTDKKVKEFQKMYFEEFGKKISFDKTKESATNLIDLYKLIFKPRPEPVETQTKSQDT